MRQARRELPLIRHVSRTVHYLSVPPLHSLLVLALVGQPVLVLVDSLPVLQPVLEGALVGAVGLGELSEALEQVVFE